MIEYLKGYFGPSGLPDVSAASGIDGIGLKHTKRPEKLEVFPPEGPGYFRKIVINPHLELPLDEALQTGNFAVQVHAIQDGENKRTVIDYSELLRSLGFAVQRPDGEVTDEFRLNYSQHGIGFRLSDLVVSCIGKSRSQSLAVNLGFGKSLETFFGNGTKAVVEGEGNLFTVKIVKSSKEICGLLIQEFLDSDTVSSIRQLLLANDPGWVEVFKYAPRLNLYFK